MCEDISKIKQLLIKEKETNSQKVSFLVEKMLATENSQIRDNIAFFLVDHFKDPLIENSLIKLIEDKRWVNHRGTLLYLLNEYTNDNKYLIFLIDLLINNDEDNGELYMNVYIMITSLQVPMDKNDITVSLESLEKENSKTENAEKRIIQEKIILYLKEQLRISDFYERLYEY